MSVVLIGCGTPGGGGGHGSGDDAAVDSADVCAARSVDVTGWERYGVAILDSDAQYLLSVKRDMAGTERVDVSLEPPTNHYVEQPPKWNGMLSPPDFEISDRDAVYPRDVSIQVLYQNAGASYMSRSGSMTLLDLEMPTTPGTALQHYHYVLHDVVMTSDTAPCLRLSADVAMP